MRGFLAWGLVAWVLGGCGGEPTETSLSISPASASLLIGDRLTFTADLVLSNDDRRTLAGEEVAWSSSDPGVVFIDVDGLADSRALGTATIVASAHGFSSTATVTVRLPEVTGISITPPYLSFECGPPAIMLIATADYEDNTRVDVTATADWSSSDSAVALVDGGLVTRGQGGTATITATYEGRSASITVLVAYDCDRRIIATEVWPRTAYVLVGQALAFAAAAIWNDGTSFDVTDEATWTSGDPSVASIGEPGAVLGVSPGTTAITATYMDLTSDAASLTVLPADAVTGLAISPDPATVPCGYESLQLNAVGHLQDGGELDLTDSAVWTSSDTTIATVFRGTVFTNATGGSVTITATFGPFSATAQIDVPCDSP